MTTRVGLIVFCGLLLPGAPPCAVPARNCSVVAEAHLREAVERELALPEGRRGLVSVVLRDGRVVAAGGVFAVDDVRQATIRKGPRRVKKAVAAVGLGLVLGMIVGVASQSDVGGAVGLGVGVGVGVGMVGRGRTVVLEGR
jgi:hypothetical protein